MSHAVRPVQGILKASSQSFPLEAEAYTSCPSAITWDEEIIAEHDKERGTRMKIDEPNTPYYISSESMEEHDLEPFNLDGDHEEHQHDGVDQDHKGGAVCADELRKRLEILQERRDQGLRDDSEESLDEGELKEGPKKKEFEARRRAHYNEFLVMKQLRSSGSLDESDDDSDASNNSNKKQDR